MIIEVWGAADAFDVVFEQEESGKWIASVPSDLIDGKYIVEIFALNNAGTIGYYTGILYITNGELTNIRIAKDKYRVAIMTNRYTARITERLYTRLASEGK